MGFKSRTQTSERSVRGVKPASRYAPEHYALVSHKLCPRVQRPIIALEEKGLPYNLEYIDLDDKPDWFLELSPLGRVPILRTDAGVLFNTSVITDYLDEITPDVPLHPADPLERAFHRSWVEFVCTILLDEERLERAPDETEARLAVQVVGGKLAHLEKRLESPLFAGDWFSLVDAAAAPLLQRLHWLDELAPRLGIFESVPKVSAWRHALLERDSVHSSLVPNVRDLFVAWLQRANERDEGEPSYLGAFTLPQEVAPAAERIYPDAL